MKHREKGCFIPLITEAFTTRIGHEGTCSFDCIVIIGALQNFILHSCLCLEGPSAALAQIFCSGTTLRAYKSCRVPDPREDPKSRSFNV